MTKEEFGKLVSERYTSFINSHAQQTFASFLAGVIVGYFLG